MGRNSCKRHQKTLARLSCYREETMKDSLLGLAAGIIFLLVGLAMLAGSYHATTRYVKTNGQIVDAKEEEDLDDGRIFYAPIVDFTTPDQKTHRFTSSVSTKTEPVMGEIVPILYNPTHPDEVVIENRFNMYGLPGILTAFGIFFTSIFTFGPKRGILHQKQA